MQKNQRYIIQWLSILQGWSMLLVVIGHVVLTDNISDQEYPISSYIYQVIYSFHMPLFIFTSGWLLYYTSLSKNKSFCDVLKSKSKRLLIPFYAFTIITTLVKLIFHNYVKRPINTRELIETFILYSSNPLKELWFIVVLFVLILGYPIYLQMIKKLSRELFFLLIGFLLFIFCPNNIHLFFFHKFIYLYFFFILGIIVAHYDLIDKIKNPIIFILSACFFIICNIFNTAIIGWMGFINCLTGIFFSICLCKLLSKYFPLLFSSFREYTFQIYLIGMFPQMALRIVYLHNNLEYIYILLVITSILMGIYIPVFISRFLIKHPSKLNLMFGL